MSYGWTKGPWFVRGGYCDVVSQDDDRRVAALATNRPSVEVRATAHLIAAAPDLYDFVATLENDDGKIPVWLWEMRTAVLAKARGDTP